MVKGEMQGFKILSIRYKSIFRELGLKNGDVIERVNGKQLDSIESSLGLFQDLRNSSSFTIDVQRQGKKESLRYEVK
jgi:general secretion pathway protein C